MNQCPMYKVAQSSDIYQNEISTVLMNPKFFSQCVEKWDYMKVYRGKMKMPC